MKISILKLADKKETIIEELRINNISENIISKLNELNDNKEIFVFLCLNNIAKNIIKFIETETVFKRYMGDFFDWFLKTNSKFIISMSSQLIHSKNIWFKKLKITIKDFIDNCNDPDDKLLLNQQYKLLEIYTDPHQNFSRFLDKDFILLEYTNKDWALYYEKIFENLLNIKPWLYEMMYIFSELYAYSPRYFIKIEDYWFPENKFLSIHGYFSDNSNERFERDFYIYKPKNVNDFSKTNFIILGENDEGWGHAFRELIKEEKAHSELKLKIKKRNEETWDASEEEKPIYYSPIYHSFNHCMNVICNNKDYLFEAYKGIINGRIKELENFIDDADYFINSNPK